MKYGKDTYDNKKRNIFDFSDTKDYFEAINEFQVLTHEEEIELIAKAKNGCIDSREKIINHNLKLVISIAKKIMRGYSIPLIDLISEGNFGLMTGLEKFDPSRGLKFGTYATWWIRAYIYKAIYNVYEPTRKKSINTRELIKKVVNRINEVNSLRGYNIDPYEIYDELLLNPKEIKTMNEYFITLRHCNEDAEFSTYKDYYEKKEELSKFGVNTETLKEIMDKCLNEREKKILYHRFSLKETLEVISVNPEFDLTKERIRQIEEAALEKLKRAIMLNEKYNGEVGAGFEKLLEV